MTNLLRKNLLRNAVIGAGLFLMLAQAGFAADAGTSNAVENVQVKTEGDVVIVRVDMAEEITTRPNSWSVVEPPRVVLDFPATANKTGKNLIPVSASDLKSMNVVQTDELTRLVLNLYRPSQYTVDSAGKVLYVRLQNLAAAAARVDAVGGVPLAKSEKASPVLRDDPAFVREIGFRRGDEGQALISVELTDSNVPVDIKRDGDLLKVEISGVQLPDRLQAKRDVNDFATPVNSLLSTSSANTTRLEIASRGAWFHQSRLSGNQLLVEVKPIPQSDSNRLVQAGQTGQKVSINFFDADVTMILRTLAEISGKNVMIDPSLSGRKVTVALDNIAYDQALDIVMAQANAGMRIRNEVILFGDRIVLQKRDQDAADELARANETAPLVAETFTLSYIKPSEIVALIKANIASPTTTNGAAPSGNTGAAAGAGTAAGSTGASSGSGMLSARGVISPHDLSKKLFVRDTVAVIESIREMIRSVDTAQKQVMIEARIVSATTGTTSSLGVRLNLYNSGTATLGGQVRVGTGSAVVPTYGNTSSFGDAIVPSLVTYSNRMSSGVSLANTPNAGLMIFNNSATRLLAMEIEANEKDNMAKALSAPRVVTESGKAATISTTTTQTYLAGVNNGTATYAQCVGPISLKVTPVITEGNQVQMTLNIKRGNARIVTIGAAQGCESTVDAIDTNLTMDDGGTIVIGGVTIEDESKSVDRLPFFGDLPYVGFLFKSTGKQVARKELLIFLTPRIVNRTAS